MDPAQGVCGGAVVTGAGELCYPLGMTYARLGLVEDAREHRAIATGAEDFSDRAAADAALQRWSDGVFGPDAEDAAPETPDPSRYPKAGRSQGDP